MNGSAGAAVRLGWLGVVVLAAALPYDVLADVDPAAMDLGATSAHLLGTDHLGRDVVRRLAAGGRAFLVPGVGAAALATAGGVLVGAGIGWWGGAPAVALRAGLSAIAAIPGLALVLLLLLVTGPGPGGLALAAGLVAFPATATALADRVQALRGAEFVVAARGHGLSDARVLWWHLVWINGRGLLAREALATLGQVLVLDVTLSYLGSFGVAEPASSWGNMIAHAVGSGSPNVWTWAAPVAATLLTLWATVYDPEAR